MSLAAMIISPVLSTYGMPPAAKSASRRGSQLTRIATLDFQPPAPSTTPLRVRMLRVLPAGDVLHLDAHDGAVFAGLDEPDGLVLGQDAGAEADALLLEVVVHHVPEGDAAGCPGTSSGRWCRRAGLRLVGAGDVPDRTDVGIVVVPHAVLEGGRRVELEAEMVPEPQDGLRAGL